MKKSWTHSQMDSFLDLHFSDQTDRVWALMNKWMDRGDKVAIYVNEDLSSPDLGSVKIVSYGSAAAQLEVDEPPTTLPDLGGEINWRYQLKGTYERAV